MAGRREMTLDEILEEMDELLAELTGLVATPRGSDAPS
jgi:ribosomal protein L29